MKQVLLLSGFLLYFNAATKAQADTDTLSVVNWNIEYFADPSNSNPAVQVSKARIIMNNINADAYALCEIVNVDSLASLAQSLNGDYGYIVSTFGSLASSPSSSGYASAQKLAFVYRKSMFRNITARALLSTSQNAYTNFASGRFPYLVNTEVIGHDGIWRSIKFIVLHAKAYSDYDACTRRVFGCRELKDTLSHYFASERFLLLGDYNDDVDNTICSSYTISNYWDMVSDSNFYHCLTLPISRAGAFSIDGYTSLIDHVIASPKMFPYYIPNSAYSLRNEVKSWVSNYSHDVSDHFPIITQYYLDQSKETGVKYFSGTAETVKIYPVPANDNFYIECPFQGSNYQLSDINGSVILQGTIIKNKQLINVASVHSGFYMLRISTAQGMLTEKISIQR